MVRKQLALDVAFLVAGQINEDDHTAQIALDFALAARVAGLVAAPVLRGQRRRLVGVRARVGVLSHAGLEKQLSCGQTWRC